MTGNPSRINQWRTSLFILFTVCNIAILLLNVEMYLHMYIQKSKTRHDVLNAELRATSSYSECAPQYDAYVTCRSCWSVMMIDVDNMEGPIFDLVDLEPSIRLINGTVVAPEHPSIARQFPNSEADAQWEQDIDLIRPIAITREQIIKMGKNPETVAKLEDQDWGLGDNAYVAALDVFHNLHCLNTLRRAAYGTYYSISADANNRNGHLEGHLNHCADILFQHISCSNNVNLVTRHWREEQEYPFPDFSINKYCINFEKLLTWHKEVGLDQENYIKTMKKPKGAKTSTTAT
ncbi:hypothetical protein CCM_03166 [Cordyceps militaris CM01]|uniref:Tat pathway signal sequence n=1 Tax=Cordyceps militaris (strain CM01) TaxID=983644 RepID=G3J966_CORMM|nr:uncharacterized protein CCM_03166 [Cordyceps militaris CM01]EGX94895.1 hypothetical protein CCM_03166 [Cordyceps militaris CM01]